MAVGVVHRERLLRACGLIDGDVQPRADRAHILTGVMGGNPSQIPAVLVGGGHIALAVGRSLADAGIDVYALGAEEDPLRRSNHCREVAVVGSGQRLQEGSLEWLERRGLDGAVVIPCDDEPLQMLAENRSRIVEWGYRPIDTDDEVVLAMLDKDRTYEIAEGLGVAIPRRQLVRTAEEAEAAAAEIGFPCAVKPLVSHEWARQFPLHTKALKVSNPDELREVCASFASLDAQVMLTQFIPGHDNLCWAYLAYLTKDGKPLMEATKQRIRQYLPGFGSSSFTMLRWDEETAREGLRFLREVGARGPVYVEFKRDPTDGRLKLIECNHRFTGPTPLLRRGGLDLALLTYNQVIGADGPAPGHRREGIALWDPWKDFRAFLAYRRQGEESLPSWLRSLMRPLVFPLADLRDPRPSMASAWRWISRNVRRRLPWTGEAG
jgi:predicted ATP-grasp superfamily ATP-dependent carboligase